MKILRFDQRISSRRARGITGWLLGALSLSFAANSQTPQYPATSVSQGTLATFAQANAQYGTATARTYNIPSVLADYNANRRPVQIRVLAKGLGAADVVLGRISQEEYANRAYEYVRQNLQPVFMYGEQKGALGALLDQAGTAFDQSSLLVALLKEAGITSVSFQLGTISLSDTATDPNTGLPLNQFYDWTGIADGTVACRLLADGGIPAEINGATNADCSGMSGPINSIKLRHAWVTATIRQANGTDTTRVFDPAYKKKIWATGIDLGGILGCGTGGGCASFLQGYLPQQTTVGGAPALQDINSGTLENAFLSYAKTLLTNLRGRNPGLDLQAAVGGGQIDAASFKPAGASLPYGTSDIITVGAIPDQYRIRLRVQFGLIDKLLFADELAGKRLRILGDVGLDVQNHTAAPLQVNLYAEYEILASNSNQVTTEGPNPLTLTVDHPYAAANGTMQDVSTVFETHSFLDDTPPGTTSAIGFRFDPITIMTAFGPTGQGTASLYADLQNKNIYLLDVTDKTNPAHTWSKCQPYQAGGPSVRVDEGASFNYDCLFLNQASIGANWLAQNEKLVDLIGRVNNSHVLTHHIIGFVKSGAIDTPLMSFDSSFAVASRTNSALDRKSASFAISAMSSRLEGTMTEQIDGTAIGMAGPAVMDMANARSIPLVYATQANFAALRSSLDLYPSWLLDRVRDTYLANGFVALLPKKWELGFYHTPGASDETGISFNFGAFYVYKPAGDKSAYIVAWGLKGTGGLSEPNPADEVLASLKQRDASLKSPSFHKVDLQNGALTITPPADLVTGIGPFPNSLSFQRVYSSADSGLPQSVSTRGTKAGRSVRPWEAGTALRYGWKHNLDIRSELGSNFYRSLGESSAIDATVAIATIYLLRDLHRASGTFGSEVVSTYLANWWGKQLHNNEFNVSFGGQQVSYLRMPDDSYVPSSDDGSKLVRTGTDNGGFYVYPMINYGALRWDLTNADGSTIHFELDGLYTWQGTQYMPFPKSRTYYPKYWNFPGGINVNFVYANLYPISGPETEFNHVHYCLQEVNNSLGRKIIFHFAADNRPDEGECVVDSVTDESGRSVHFEDSDEAGNAQTFNPPDHTFTITQADGTKVNYHYRSTTDEPGTARAVDVIDSWSFGDSALPFVQVEYDELFRVASLSTAPNNEAGIRSVTNFGIGGLSIGENLRRGEMRDPTGGVDTQYFNRAGLRVLQTDAFGNSTWSTYDALNRLTKVVRPELDSSEFEYDIRNNLTKTTDHPKPGSPFPDRVTSTTYAEGPTVRTCTTPACNKPATSTDVKSKVTTITYYPNGQLKRIRRPSVSAGIAEVDFCYTSIDGMSMLTGRVQVVSTSPAKPNRVKTYTYDPTKKYVLDSMNFDPKASLSTTCAAVTKSTGLDRITRLTYDPVGNVHSLDGPRTDVTDVKTYAFDELRRLKEEDVQMGSDPQYAVTKFEYYPDGTLWTISKKDENAVWRTETRSYWPSGALRTAQDPEGHIIQYVYDLSGRTRAQIDPDHRAVATVYDVGGRTTCIWKGADPGNLPSDCAWIPGSYAGLGKIRFVAYDYSPNGKTTALTDANGNTTKFVFDGFDRPRFTFYPNAPDGSYCTLPSSAQVDIDSGTVTCTASGGKTPAYESLSYTSNGTPTGTLCGAENEVCRKRTRANGTITFTYDALGRMSGRTATGIPGASFTYNLVDEILTATSSAGTVNSVTVPAHTTTYDYDDVGGLTYEENLVGGAARRVSFQYDDAGNRSRTTWQDGYYVTYWYDELDRMTYVRENSTTSNELARYQYDPMSRRKEIRYAGVSANTVSYTYEADSNIDTLTNTQSSEVVSFDYGHNASGQISSLNSSDGFYIGLGALQPDLTTYTPNKLNQYSSVQNSVTGTNTPGYDNNGNLSGWGPTATRSSYTYDSENRLRRAVVTGGATTDYDYDVLGRRISKVVGTTPTYYQLDGKEEITEYDGSGAVLRRYITGAVTDERIATVYGTQTVDPPKTFYHFNHQGSVLATTSNTGSATTCPVGTVCQKLAYDAYGKLLQGSSTTGQPFRFSGRRYDEETGLYYFRARYYLPEAGRFLQADPIGFEDDSNLYAYVGNDPLNAVDLLGTCRTDGNGTLIIDDDCEVVYRVPNKEKKDRGEYPYDDVKYADMTDKQKAEIQPSLDQVGEAGGNVEKNGTQEEKDAFENVQELAFTPSERKTDRDTGGEVLAETNGRSIIFYKGAMNAKAEKMVFIITHEIFHGVPEFRAKFREMEAMVPDRKRKAQRITIEIEVDDSADAFLRKTGKLSGARCYGYDETLCTKNHRKKN